MKAMEYGKYIELVFCQQIMDISLALDSHLAAGWCRFWGLSAFPCQDLPADLFTKKSSNGCSWEETHPYCNPSSI